MTSIRAILFDFGHTLVDFTRTEEALREAYGVVRDRLAGWVEDRAPPETDELVERIARAVDAMVGRSYEERRLEELDQVALFQEAFSAIGYSLLPMLHALRAAGVALFADREYAEALSVARERCEAHYSFRVARETLFPLLDKLTPRRT